MPHVKIETNVELDKIQAHVLATKFSALSAELLGKPEGFVQACVQPVLALAHGGSFDPAAFVLFKSIGLPFERCQGMSSAICAFLEKELGIPPDRVYIEFGDLQREHFGWNSGTF